jgi:hypothetical protein
MAGGMEVNRNDEMELRATALSHYWRGGVDNDDTELQRGVEGYPGLCLFLPPECHYVRPF